MEKTAIVTGAASGIGRAIALGLLGAGINVAGVDRSAEWLAEVARAAEGLKGRFVSILADLAEPGACDKAVAQAEGALGAIEALVNNAGIGQASVRPGQPRWPIKFWEITPEQWQLFLAVNATAPLMMARAVAPKMIRAGKGRIVTVTTSLGTMIRGGYVLYGASKASAEASAAVMAADLAGTGVTVNVVVPGGMTDTRIIPDGQVQDRSKMIRPEVMVPPLLWLLSDEAADVTARRFLAVHWNPALPPAEAAERAGAPIAWTSIATMPIEPD
ncbi:MAG TPA: SDR family NAD(P)-dependent oxidoreductase [Acetobacteraceae bacterium]|nr:SDR family NAD(P)-dependent oxidoreductase [Acetobacteraceae bacterium]